MKHDGVLKALKEIVGEELATDNEIVLAPYSYDVRELSTPTRPAGHAEFAVTPETPQQISKILQLANKRNVLVTPVVFQTDIGENAIPVADPVPIWFTDSKVDSNRAGAAIPVEGGIVLDLHRMNKIIEINEDDYYAVVEPGVSMGMLERELRSRGLWFPLPMSPPNASSVAANVLLVGIGHIGSKVGSQADMINGLEAILPTGEVIRGGSCAFSDSWHAKGPIPDVTGLFI
ncbi:MAG: FAD-dependent oxidoreductase, partial [Syntrophomonadaceae bacterium]|nr:FAD-dependent oxidoreductase [Syntrophomonadaceae bacterium]